MRAIAKMPGSSTPRVIHRSREKQLCCTWECLVFLDSLNILSGSLAKLIADARKEGDLKCTFPLTHERHPFCGDDEELDLLSRKLPMCYSSLNDPAVMGEDYPTPAKAAFRDDMRDEPVDEEAWANLQRLREKRDIHTMPRLHDAYLACDVLLLADIIENNRRAFKEVLGLDLLRFLTML